MWQDLDLSDSSGVTCRKTEEMMAVAAAHARGALRTLNLNGFRARFTYNVLLAVVTANAGSLRTLYLRGFGYKFEQYEALLLAAPDLHISDADLWCDDVHAACRVLAHKDGHFERVQLRGLSLDCELRAEDEEVFALAAAVCSHPSLKFLYLEGLSLDTAASFDAVVDAALRQELTCVKVADCNLTLTCAPALARLCASSALTELYIHGLGSELEGINTALAFAIADSLRANSTLTLLTLYSLGMWDDPAVGTSLLGALTGHPTIQTLELPCMFVPEEHRAAAGAAVGALVAANAPALKQLVASYAWLGDAGLGPLVDALPQNTHLSTLDLLAFQDGGADDIGDAFARDRLLPAVRANTSLRELKLNSGGASGAEAVRLVQQRSAE